MKDAKATREFVRQLLTALNGINCPLDEPYATHFNALKANYNSVLETLPPSDMVPAAAEANWNLGTLLSCMMSAQSLVTSMGASLSEMKTKMSDALSSVNSKAEAILAEKLKTGELVPKETATALCSAARATALDEGRAEVRAEMVKKDAAAKIVTDRRALLSKNGLPLPENDAALAGTEEEFTAMQAKAKTRIEALRGKGLALNSVLMAKAWLADADFSTFEALVAETQKRPGAAEPFATPAAANGGSKIPGGIL